MAFGPCGPCGGTPINPFGGPAASPWAQGGGASDADQGPAPGTSVGPPEPVPESDLGPIVGPPDPDPEPDPDPDPGIGPEPVALLTAGDFKILAKSGITNVPTSSVIGDMGVSPITDAAITGFALVLDGSGEFSTSAQVVGQVFAANYAPPTPAKMTQAILDMEAAYTDAAGRPADFVNVNAGIIGGLVLVPGVYKWTTGVTIPSDITLLGGANDRWIFQIDGTLVMASAARVLFQGGGQKQNVVWQVAGAITIGTDAEFKGTILAQTSIAIQTRAEVLGRLFAQTAVTLDQNLVNGP